MRTLVLAAAALSVAVAGNALAATRCKDAKGKFAKCGTPGAMPM